MTEEPAPKHTTSCLLAQRFEDAVIFATRLHATQVRKGTAIPYVAHLLAVASIVLEDEHGKGSVFAFV